MSLLVNPTSTEHGNSYFKSTDILDSDENDASGEEPNDGVDDIKEFLDTTLDVCTNFAPLHLISQWKEPCTRRNCIKVCILLPSGGANGNWSINMSSSGLLLILVVEWPKPMVVMQLLHKKWVGKML